MNALLSSLDVTQPIEAPLEQIIEHAICNLEDGQAVDVEALAAMHPEFAEQLRELIPMVAALVAIGRTDDAPLHLSCTNDGALPSGRQQLGDFRLIREIGRGGMGVVYEAEQISLGRRVALKVLPFAAMLDKQQLNRFKNEARAVGTLDHPNIVAIHSVGVERGVHYYAMQLVEGQSLAQLIAQLRRERGMHVADRGCREGDGNATVTQHSAEPAGTSTGDTQPIAALSTTPDYDSREYYRTVAKLGIQAAEALDHAHQNGILHRDVKPANLMVDADDKLWMTDFGLARIEQDAGMTMTGDIVGTLRYMSPEQALAKRGVVDFRSDIYSLGVTVYELLTLQPAFTGHDRQELIRQIAFEDPQLLRKIDRRIPAELETIVLKAMAKNPSERYNSARQLADDFLAFREHRPIKARRPTWREQVVKWSRRHVAVVWYSAAAFMICAIAFMLASIKVTKWYRESERQRAIAIAQLSETQKQQDIAKAISGMLLNMLEAANPEHDKSRDYTVRELLNNASAELDAQPNLQPEVEAAIRLTIGNAYRTLEIYDQAGPQIKAALAIRRRAFGPNDESVADTLLYYVSFLRGSELRAPGDEIVVHARRALEIYRASGSIHGQIRAAASLGQSLASQGGIDKTREAETVYKTGLTLAGDLSAVQYPEVATLLHGLARVQNRLGKTAEAELTARKAVSLHRRLHGDAHPETAWGLNTLGDVLESQHRHIEAEAAFREAYGILRQRYSPVNHSVEWTRARLMTILKSETDPSKLATFVGEWLRDIDQFLHANPSSATGWQDRGVIHIERQEYSEAVEAFAKACEFSEYKNPFMIDALAKAFAEEGDFESAVKWSEKAMGLAVGPGENERFESHLETFRQNRPWRDTSQKD